MTKKIVNSTTIYLPTWKRVLGELGIPIKIIPRDIQTRWNSTHDMGKTYLEVVVAIKKFMAEFDVDDDIRALELTKKEVGLLRQLVDVLSVSTLAFECPGSTRV